MQAKTIANKVKEAENTENATRQIVFSAQVELPVHATNRSPLVLHLMISHQQNKAAGLRIDAKVENLSKYRRSL